MQVHFTFKQMEATEALKQHAQEQTEKLKKFVHGDGYEAQWVFFVDADTHVADLRVVGPHVDFFGQGRTTDLYHSMDEARDKVEKQLKKHKEILKDHLHRS